MGGYRPARVVGFLYTGGSASSREPSVERAPSAPHRRQRQPPSATRTSYCILYMSNSNIYIPYEATPEAHSLHPNHPANSATACHIMTRRQSRISEIQAHKHEHMGTWTDQGRTRRGHATDTPRTQARKDQRRAKARGTGIPTGTCDMGVTGYP